MKIEKMKKLKKCKMEILNIWNRNKILLLYVVISFAVTMIVFLHFRDVLPNKLGFGYAITANNRGDYLSVFGAHCSTVFLTTSLMAMLSERNIYIYTGLIL